MDAYVAPVEDYRFLLSQVLGFDLEMAELGSDLDTELAVSILDEAGKLCTEVLHPINQSGDEEGSRIVDGEVTTPSGFSNAYATFRDAGWPSLSADTAHGGQGLPFVLQLWVDEMLSASNLSFGLFPALTRGAAEAIAAHATDAVKSTYLSRMVSGEWSGAMALTESSAGSDLSLIKTKASPQADGSHTITGQKIFISSGDHDFGGNIIHLVLARLPDAPAGVSGISLFLVPKFLPDAAGACARRNTMAVGSLEHKMGIHAQPTCVMNYDDAIGWLVGEPNRGLAAMFTMMNAERLMVGMQGLGVAASAYQQAAVYAKGRSQGRGASGASGTVAIVEHVDVRRMLLDVRSFVEGGRALAGWVALQVDRARKHPDPDERTRADGFVALLTPVIKAAFTDMGFESAVQAQQVFGGHGYIREWGMEQLVRDARIAQIYEGTNGIQALDLVGRKLSMAGGTVVDAYFALIEGDLDRAADGSIAKNVVTALETLRGITVLLKGADPQTLGAAAVDYLRMFALVSLGWMWLRMECAAEQGSTPLDRAKIDIARYFATRVLPRVSGMAATLSSGPEPIMALPVDAF